MNDLTTGYRTWILLLAGFGAAADRPPIEAAKPQPAGAVEPAAKVAAEADGPNSGGPGAPADEGGTRAPAAEAEASKPLASKDRPTRGIWARRPTEQPRPLLPEIAEDAKSVAPPAEPVRPTDPLDRQVDAALDVTARRVLIAESADPRQRPHTPWQIGHGMLAFRRDYVVRVRGEKVNAYEWLATNPIYQARVKRGKDAETTVEKMNWFYLTPYGARPQKFTGEPYEFEGHPNQFLAFFALARIPLDFEFTIQGRKVTFGDMLNNAKMEVNDREEVTWDLWAFAYYFDPDTEWRNAKGEAWSMERLVSTTLKQFSPTKSPCGGCHALFALASARNAYVQTKSGKFTGAWTEAHVHLEKHIQMAKQMQNRDGSFSSNYFKGPGYASDPSKRISTTGHTLEFLMMAMRQDQLQEKWVRNAVSRLSNDLIQYQAEPLEVGGMYHAADALVLYRERTRPQLAAATKPVEPVAADEVPTARIAAPATVERTAEAPKSEEPRKLELGAAPKKSEAPVVKPAAPARGMEMPKAETPAGAGEPRKLDDLLRQGPKKSGKPTPAEEGGPVDKIS